MAIKNNNNEFFSIDKNSVFFILASLGRAELSLGNLINEQHVPEDVLDSYEFIQNILNIFGKIFDDKKIQQEFIDYAYEKFNTMVISSENDSIVVSGNDTLQ